MSECCDSPRRNFRLHTVDGSEIPNNHLGCVKNRVNNGTKNYQHQLRLAVYPIIYRVSYIPGGLIPDFWLNHQRRITAGWVFECVFFTAQLGGQDGNFAARSWDGNLMGSNIYPQKEIELEVRG